MKKILIIRDLSGIVAVLSVWFLFMSDNTSVDWMYVGIISCVVGLTANELLAQLSHKEDKCKIKYPHDFPDHPCKICNQK